VARDPGREQVVGVLGQVVPHEGVEEVLVAAEPGVGERHELTVTRPARVRTSGSSARIAAATSIDGEVDEAARASTSTRASWLPPIMRRRRSVVRPVMGLGFSSGTTAR
jgi:hypothetical protein